ncbi:ferric reductase [Sphaerisporangium melleum]|uniref:Ferric reductase n=1 Tax=Sphaerisporangium melleum TaxID=321316 RepID=A0A917QV78_9ACTN|nr:ferredoxin reductase family protein [Sphaerisporangium melleum]GGK68953.1 ferric reductase [Sphaerisporangium melleum]GII68955.1 ferric reductase [Sphaerisporangium melleum]
MTTIHAERPTAPGRHQAVPPGGARAHPVAVLAVIGAGALAVLGLWWANTPAVTGLGDALTGAGRITGLLAGYAIVVLLALMARVPALERGVGSDRLARWHAMGGRYTVGLAVAHTLLIIWGYAVTDATGLVDETITLNLSYPDVLKATVAVLLLVGVGVISARAVRPRLRYETWFHLHFYTYLAAYLAFGHQLATGAEFQDARLAQAAWYGLYLGVAGLLLWYRFLTPVRQSLKHRLRVAQVVHEGPGIFSVYVTGRRLDRLRAEPGQFFRWRFLNRHLWWSANPYSLSAAPRHDVLRITVKDLGDHSREITRLRPGTRVIAEGPYGAFTPARRKGHKVLLIAGGVGITPLRALFEAIPAAPGDLTLLYRASNPDDLAFRAELEQIAAQRGAALHYSVGPRAEIGEPFTPEVLSGLVPQLPRHDVYVCGPDGMTRDVIAALRAAGVHRRRIHHESFEF